MFYTPVFFNKIIIGRQIISIEYDVIKLSLEAKWTKSKLNKILDCLIHLAFNNH